MGYAAALVLMLAIVILVATLIQRKFSKEESHCLPLKRLVERGLNDMRVLLTDVGHGAFPVAGLPTATRRTG